MSLFPHLTEKMIQAAQERGEFENLPGAGKPIPDLDEPYDELWWVRKWMAREGLNPSKELRAEGGSPALVAALDAVRAPRGRGSLFHLSAGETRSPGDSAAESEE